MNYVIYLLTLFSSISFFNYRGLISTAIGRLMFYGMVIFSLMMALTERNSGLKDVDYPRTPYRLLLAGLCISILSATFMHGQAFRISLTATLPYIFSYLYFYILMRLRIPSDKILKGLGLLCLLAIPVYFANALTYPNNMFGEPLEDDFSRGILRIPVIGIHFFVLLLFFGIGKWNLTKEKKWLFLIAITGLMIILSVVRQAILVSGVLSVFFLFKHWRWYTKAIGIAAIAGVILVVVPHIPMYQTMMELSEDQLEKNENEEDIRITAWRFYTYESWENPITVIFGNGIPSIGNSDYGNRFATDADATACFAEDVGWAGMSYYFGLLTTIALMILLAKAALRRKPPQKEYLSYWLIFIFITSVASAPILYYFQAIGIAIVLYLVYNPDDEENRIDNTQLQQF